MIRNFSAQELAARKSPFPHLVLRDFLERPAPVAAELKAQQFFAKDTDLFSFNQTHNLFHTKSRVLQSVLASFASPKFAAAMKKAFGVKLERGAVDVFGAYYGRGDYLLCHDDELEGRKIAFILYLSPDFAERDGGALSLYSAKQHHPHKKIASYPPLYNSFAAFKVSPDSWHEVEEVLGQKRRYSITGWLY